MKPREWAVLLIVLARPSVAAGQSDDGRVFHVDGVVDGIGALALTGSALLLDANKHRWTGLSPCASLRRSPTAEERAAFEALPEDGGLCDVRDVPPLERWVTELRWKPAALLSDAALLALVTSPLAFSAIDTPVVGADAERLGNDSAVLFQTLGATYLATVIIKMAVARPRPLTYNRQFDKAERFAGSARLSFPSGHASLAFASASVLSVMLAERFGDRAGVVAGVTSAYLVATTVAVLRVVGGKHFVTDVVAGAVLGIAMGLTIPLLHTKSSREPRSSPPGLPSMGVPMAGFGGVF